MRGSMSSSRTHPPATPLNERGKARSRFQDHASWPTGYDVSNVQVTGTLAGRRIDVNGRGAAYGGTATARGFIVDSVGSNPAFVRPARHGRRSQSPEPAPSSRGAGRDDEPVAVAVSRPRAGQHALGRRRAEPVDRRRGDARRRYGCAVRRPASGGELHGARKRSRTWIVERIGRAFERDRRCEAGVREPSERHVRREGQCAPVARGAPASRTRRSRR